MFESNLKSLYALFFVLFASLLLTGCSDDDDDDITIFPTYVSGTAATGAPIVGTVTLTDASGNVSGTVTIDVDGSFSIPTLGLTPPFILRAEDAGSNYFYSWIDGNGTANVTELSTLALWMSSGIDPQLLYSEWSDRTDELVDTEITTAAMIIYANLSELFTAAGLGPVDYDFINTPFDADSTGLDAVLDGIDVAIDFSATGSGSITITNTLDSSTIPFNVGIDLSAIDFEGLATEIETALNGDYDLVITGTVTTNGVTVNFTDVTVEGVPAPANVAEIENALNETYETAGVTLSGAVVTLESESSDTIVYNVGFTLETVITEPIELTTTSVNDLTYTYTLRN